MQVLEYSKSKNPHRGTITYRLVVELEGLVYTANEELDMHIVDHWGSEINQHVKRKLKRMILDELATRLFRI